MVLNSIIGKFLDSLDRDEKGQSVEEKGVADLQAALKRICEEFKGTEPALVLGLDLGVKNTQSGATLTLNGFGVHDEKVINVQSAGNGALHVEQEGIPAQTYPDVISFYENFTADMARKLSYDQLGTLSRHRHNTAVSSVFEPSN